MKQVDLPLLLSVLLLSLFGLFMIYDASSFIAFRDFGNKYHYFREQLSWLFLGILGMTFFSFFSYHKLYTLALPILLSSIFLLILVFIPGIGVWVLGARRWVNFGLLTLQPAEYAKLALAIYLSAWFSHKEKKRLGAFLLLLGIVMGLIMFEPDMGTAAIILAEALIVYFFSGGSLLSIILLLPIILLGGIILAIIEPYRAARIATFLSPNVSLQTSSYHVKQILIALGMGGLTGVGLGNSLQKYAYLPENATDSIFAIIAEEFGLIGAISLIMVYLFILWHGFFIASFAKDAFGKLLALAITSFLIVQVLVNLAAQTVLIPLTGVPLPFISYGGSALVMNLCSVGILLNISKRA